MDGLTELQFRILAELEEAGEDDLSALTNTVTVTSGAIEELGEMSSALIGLLESDLLRLSRSRDTHSLRRVPLSTSESLAQLTSLESFFRWSVPDKLWRWRENVSRVELLLTTSGMTAARQLLSERGVPKKS